MLQRAAASGKNFVVSHEPTFYNHLDSQTLTRWKTTTVAEKLAFIEQHGMVVWRFHDYWHARRRMELSKYGQAARLGEVSSPGTPPTFDLPETTLQNIANQVRDNSMPQTCGWWKTADEDQNGGAESRSRKA